MEFITKIIWCIFLTEEKNLTQIKKLGGHICEKKIPGVGFSSKKKKSRNPGFSNKKKIPGYQDLQGKCFGRYASDQNTDLHPNGGP